jgi:thiamine biosynthesis lipoprotein
MRAVFKVIAFALALGLGIARAEAPPAPPVHVEHRHREAMGTHFTITIADPVPLATIDAAATAALDEIDRIEALISEWRPTSEVTAINAAAGLRPVRVSPETFECVRRGLEISEQTDGGFDLTWAAFRGLWKFGPDAPHVIPDEKRIREALAHVGWRKVKLDRGAQTVFLTERGMLLGFGGIGQGFAVDRAVAVLRKHGLGRFIVDGGGDLYVAGEKAPGVPWSVGVQHPRDPDRLVAELTVREGAIVTSGDYQRSFELNGVRYHHIIDLRTGFPAREAVSTTIFSREATVADAWTKGLFVVGPKALKLLEKHPGMQGAIFTPDGRILTTPGLAKSFPARWDTPAKPPR